MYTYMYVHMCVYMHIYIYILSSSRKRPEAFFFMASIGETAAIL